MSYIVTKIIELLRGPAIKQSNVSRKSWIGSGTQVVDCVIDEYSYMGNNVQCLNTKIGKFCSIANNCVIGGAEHPIKYVSTSPVFYGGFRKPLSYSIIKCGELKWNSYNQRTCIGNDVWIGNNVIILAGVSIATGAIIGAGSVVTKDVPPYEIWGGNPAHFIRKRFDDNTVSRLIETQWWGFSTEKLTKISMYMDNPEKFLDIVECDLAFENNDR